jgi:pimeloyl-ACP methyl ester carboxylesterase
MLVEARGLEFDVRIGGPEHGEPVLLLHGFPQNSVMWDGIEPALHAAGLRTVAPDQRGYSPGARPAEVSAYAMPELVGDALAIIDALQLGPVHLVGHDWGASVAWEVAARHPDRVRTLTAVSVPHPRAFASALLTSFDQLRRSAYMLVFRREGTAERLLEDDDAKRLRGLFAGSGLSLGEVNRYVAPMLAPGALTAALNWYRAISLVRRSTTGPVTVPTTYVWSDGDVALGRAAAEKCAARVTGEYTFVALHGVSHWIPDQVPDVLAKAVLDRVGAATAGG